MSNMPHKDLVNFDFSVSLFAMSAFALWALNRHRYHRRGEVVDYCVDMEIKPSVVSFT